MQKNGKQTTFSRSYCLWKSANFLGKFMPGGGGRRGAPQAALTRQFIKCRVYTRAVKNINSPNEKLIECLGGSLSPATVWALLIISVYPADGGCSPSLSPKSSGCFFPASSLLPHLDFKGTKAVGGSFQCQPFTVVFSLSFSFPLALFSSL